MPELPDVEIYRRYLNSTALHQKIEEVEIGSAKVLKDFTKKIKISGRSAYFCPRCQKRVQ